MRTERYHRLSTATGKASDEHVACMQCWFRKSADATYRKKCLSTALKYKRSLENELAYLLTRPSSPDVDRHIFQIKNYLEIVNKDLTTLAEH